MGNPTTNRMLLNPVVSKTEEIVENVSALGRISKKSHTRGVGPPYNYSYVLSKTTRMCLDKQCIMSTALTFRNRHKHGNA